MINRGIPPKDSPSVPLGSTLCDCSMQPNPKQCNRQNGRNDQSMNAPCAPCFPIMMPPYELDIKTSHWLIDLDDVCGWKLLTEQNTPPSWAHKMPWSHYQSIGLWANASPPDTVYSSLAWRLELLKMPLNRRLWMNWGTFPSRVFLLCWMEILNIQCQTDVFSPVIGREFRLYLMQG